MSLMSIPCDKAIATKFKVISEGQGEISSSQFAKKWPLQGHKCFTNTSSFLAPLAEGQQAIVMVVCLSCVCSSVRACVRKLFLQKTSPQKLLTGLLFCRNVPRYRFTEFLKIKICQKTWLLWETHSPFIMV